MNHLPTDTRIDWNYPEPRQGLAGEWDKFIGSGAAPAENILFALSALVEAVFAFVLLSGFDWGPIKLVVAVLMAGDLFGGAVANVSSVTKRWYYRAGQTSLHQLGFILVHLGYVALVAWVFREGGHLLYFLVIGGALLLSALVVLMVSLWLRRPVAVLMVLGAILLNLYVVPPAAGLEWFVPVLGLKLILGHAVRGEPYRPASTVRKRKPLAVGQHHQQAVDGDQLEILVPYALGLPLLVHPPTRQHALDGVHGPVPAEAQRHAQPVGLTHTGSPSGHCCISGSPSSRSKSGAGASGPACPR